MDNYGDETILCKKCGKKWFIMVYRFEFSDINEPKICECGNNVNEQGATYNTFSKIELESFLDDNYKNHDVDGLLVPDIIDYFGVSADDLEALILKNKIQIQTTDVEGNDNATPHFRLEDAFKIINRENFWKPDLIWQTVFGTKNDEPLEKFKLLGV